MKNAQELATKLFITASMLFGIAGILMVTTASQGGNPSQWISKLLAVLGFIVLSSFGVSVGLKYLSK